MDTTVQSPERRQVHRVTFASSARLECGSQVVEVTVIDLSLRGALVAVDSHEQPSLAGGRCHVMLALDDTTKIDFAAHVVWQHAGMLGLQIETLDLNSIQHLRRLVELNLGDAQLLSRDLAALFSQTETGEKS